MLISPIYLVTAEKDLLIIFLTIICLPLQKKYKKVILKIVVNLALQNEPCASEKSLCANQILVVGHTAAL